MAQQIQQVYGLSGDKPSNEVGAFIKRGGIIKTNATNNLDKDIGQFFKWLHVGVGGDIVWLTPEGIADCVLGVPSGSWIPVYGSQVLTSGVVDGETINTDCNNITWQGGE